MLDVLKGQSVRKGKDGGKKTTDGTEHSCECEARSRNTTGTTKGNVKARMKQDTFTNRKNDHIRSEHV